ncbi:MAG: YicC family protein [Acidobacteriota bacterium]
MNAPLRSMTGFGEARGPLSERIDAIVRLTTVNARFLEVAVRTTPRIELAELEPMVKSVLGAGLVRGRAQLAVELRAAASGPAAFRFRWDVAQALAAELANRPAGLEVAPLSLRDLLQLPGFAEGMGELEPTAEERERLLALVAEARDRVVADREQEARALKPQIDREVAALGEFAAWLRSVNAQISAQLLGKLKERLARLLEGAEVSEERLVAEAGVLADRADVSEEVQRLEAHLTHLTSLLNAGGPVGKKLDFLLQELLREVNTAGSKCRDAGMGERVVAAKASLEKLREQFANLE